MCRLHIVYIDRATNTDKRTHAQRQHLTSSKFIACKGIWASCLYRCVRLSNSTKLYIKHHHGLIEPSIKFEWNLLNGKSINVTATAGDLIVLCCCYFRISLTQLYSLSVICLQWSAICFPHSFVHLFVLYSFYYLSTYRIYSDPFENIWEFYSPFRLFFFSIHFMVPNKS